MWALPSFAHIAVSHASSAHIVVDMPRGVELGCDAEEERTISEAVSQWFLQGLPHQLQYDHAGGGDSR